MLKACEMMNENPAYCPLDASLQHLAKRFADESVEGMMVVDDEKRLLGIITQSDLIDQQASMHLPTAIAIFDMVIPLGEEKFQQELDRLQAILAKDLMTEDIQSVDANTSIMDIANIMNESHIHFLPVLKKGNVVGVISRPDMIKALTSQIQKHI